ncbi:hypothetical protein [Halalkalirubrum salinum]|uniref:hypothetical protein n=1 Tax=Halalkalirubrum salinum TaxID=2563889 RepID=UPI0010FAFADE|nr:hypothetical protein [Halalkalirubrum salinum]
MTTRLRVAAFALSTIAILLVVSGTGGYSTAAADRSVDIDVVSDENAFLGIERNVVEVDNATVEVLTVRNQFPVEMTVNIDTEQTENESFDVEIEADEFTLAPGETREIEPTVNCNDTSAGTTANNTEVTIDISGTAPGSNVELLRSVEVSCRH